MDERSKQSSDKILDLFIGYVKGKIGHKFDTFFFGESIIFDDNGIRILPTEEMFKKLVYHDLIRTVGLYLINKEELLISSNLINEFVDFVKRREMQISSRDIAKILKMLKSITKRLKE